VQVVHDLAVLDGHAQLSEIWSSQAKWSEFDLIFS
jgi:hypothetical protein